MSNEVKQQQWSIHPFAPSAFDEEDDSSIGSYVVSFLQLDVYANPMRHGRHLFVQTNALIDYITGNRGLFKDFYRDVREKITGNKKSTKKSKTTILSTPVTKRTRPVDKLPGDTDGFLSEVWSGLYLQLDGSVDHIHDTIIQSELLFDDDDDSKQQQDDAPILMHVTNLFVVAAYFRIRYITAMNKCESLSSSATLGPTGNGVDIPTLVQRCFWRQNVLALARIVYLWELVDGSKALKPENVPADDIDATAFLSSWSRGIASETIEEPHAKRLKKPLDDDDDKTIVYDEARSKAIAVNVSASVYIKAITEIAHILNTPLSELTLSKEQQVNTLKQGIDMLQALQSRAKCRLDALNPKPSSLQSLKNVILQCIQTYPDRSDGRGMDVNTILPHIDRMRVQAGVKELWEEGHIYSTIDECHYLATHPSRTTTTTSSAAVAPPESSRRLFESEPPLREVVLHSGTVPLQEKPFESRPVAVFTHADYITGEASIKFKIVKADGHTVGPLREIQTIMKNIREALLNDVARPPKTTRPARSNSIEY